MYPLKVRTGLIDHLDCPNLPELEKEFEISEDDLMFSGNTQINYSLEPAHLVTPLQLMKLKQVHVDDSSERNQYSVCTTIEHFFKSIQYVDFNHSYSIFPLA